MRFAAFGIFAVIFVGGCGSPADPLNPPSLSEAEEFVRSNPDSVNGWLVLAAAKLQDRDYDGAIVAATNAIDKDPNLGMAYIIRGEAIMASDSDRQRAERDFNKAAEVSPRNADVWYRCGNFYAKPENRWEAYSRAIELAPGHLRARRERASETIPSRFRGQDRNPPTADEIATALADLAFIIEHGKSKMDQGFAYYIRGQLMLLQKQRNKARDVFDRASTLNPKLARACTRLLADYDVSH